jgi:hypothetical protein
VCEQKVEIGMETERAISYKGKREEVLQNRGIILLVLV